MHLSDVLCSLHGAVVDDEDSRALDIACQPKDVTGSRETAAAHLRIEMVSKMDQDPTRTRGPLLLCLVAKG